MGKIFSTPIFPLTVTGTGCDGGSFYPIWYFSCHCHPNTEATEAHLKNQKFNRLKTVVHFRKGNHFDQMDIVEKYGPIVHVDPFH